jgi:hypothetical protein
MALQAFVDESVSDKVLVLGGMIAPEEAWAKFSQDWEEILPLAPLGPDLKRNFKFSQMINAGQFRMENIPAFGQVIEAHAIATLSLNIFPHQVESAKEGVVATLPNAVIDWKGADNPYVIAVIFLVAWFSNNLEQINYWLGTDQPIEFFFDERSESKSLRDAWDRSVEALPPEKRERFGSEVRFRSDKNFLGLQAADYMAGWTRYWLERNQTPELGEIFLGGQLVRGDLKPHIEVVVPEEALVNYFLESIN